MIEIAPPPIETDRLEGSHEFAFDEISPGTKEKEFQDKLKKRVRRLMSKKENRICLDCGKPKPKWATLISVTPLHDVSHESYCETFFVGGFCCLECSGAHRRLGTHLSFVRSTELDTLKDHEIRALEYGGNKVVNNIYEGSMLGAQTSFVDEKSVEVEVVKPDADSSQKAREAFIRDKYEKKKYINIKALAKFRQSMIKRGIKSPLALASPMSMSDQISPTSTNGSESVSSPLQLRIFTSSPRTLALIDKYMNPKPKKRKVLRKMRFPLRRFSRKRNFKGSILNLRGVVNSNPNLQIVETRSEGDTTSVHDLGIDEESETSSIASTKSSMSAAVRRGLLRSKKTTADTFRGFDLRSPPFTSLPTPTPTSLLTPTPTSTKAQKRMMFFRRSQGSKQQDCPNEDKEMFEKDPTKKEIFYPSPSSSSNGSIRSRFPNLLRTPKLKNKKGSGSGQKKEDSKGSIFFSEDAAGLGIVEENTPSKYSEGDYQRDEIRALEAWSIKFDKIFSKLFKKRKTPTTLHALSDHNTISTSANTKSGSWGNKPVWSY